MLDALFDFAIGTDMTLLWDMNGASFRNAAGTWDASGNATAMLSYLDSKYGGKINFAYSVGNEPEVCCLFFVARFN